VSFWAEKSSIVITCAKGIPVYLKDEVLSLGLPVLSEGAAHIGTEGTLEDAMRLNLFIRTGHHVFFRIKEFRAKTPDELYGKISRVEWETYFSPDEYLCVTSSVETAAIRDTRFANLKCKDAIVDRMKKIFGRRPDSGPLRNGVVVHLYWKERRCLLYLDTSGEPLSKRGYRRIPLKAPMQETLAAAVILATGWKGVGDLINPMCGSGTLAIEAALIALNRAPALSRANFGFMHLKGFDESSWKMMRKKARHGTKQDLGGTIIASDRNGEAVSAARRNAATAGVDQFIRFEESDYADTPVPEGGGVVILNPPYGERLGEMEDLERLYSGIGDFFKQRCQGHTGYIFTGNPELGRKVGLRTKRKLPFYNSNIECRLLEYDLYEGSRKEKGVPN
jgi:23S rRNA G2445 N2-methylase RlmL